VKRFARLLVGGLAGAGLAGGAVVARRWSRRRGPGVAEAALVERIRDLLSASTEAGSEIAVTARRGVVSLRGEVDRLIDIAMLEAAVREQPGVVDVDNLLRLRARAPAP